MGQGSSESLGLDMAWSSVDPLVIPFHSFTHHMSFAEYVPHKDMVLGTSFLALASGPAGTQPGQPLLGRGEPCLPPAFMGPQHFPQFSYLPNGLVLPTSDNHMR